MVGVDMAGVLQYRTRCVVYFVSPHRWSVTGSLYTAQWLVTCVQNKIRKERNQNIGMGKPPDTPNS